MDPKKSAIYSVKNGRHLSNFPNFIDDKDVVLAAISYSANNISSASDRLQQDEEVALAVVKKDGFALESLKYFHNNKKVVLAAFEDRANLSYVSDDLKKDKEVVIAAMRKDHLSMILILY